jgi:hypothetical protein
MYSLFAIVWHEKDIWLHRTMAFDVKIALWKYIDLGIAISIKGSYT